MTNDSWFVTHEFIFRKCVAKSCIKNAKSNKNRENSHHWWMFWFNCAKLSNMLISLRYRNIVGRLCRPDNQPHRRRHHRHPPRKSRRHPICIKLILLCHVYHRYHVVLLFKSFQVHQVHHNPFRQSQTVLDYLPGSILWVIPPHKMLLPPRCTVQMTHLHFQLIHTRHLFQMKIYHVTTHHVTNEKVHQFHIRSYTHFNLHHFIITIQINLRISL